MAGQSKKTKAMLALTLLAGAGAAAQSPRPIVLTDVTEPAGIRFVHHNGATGKYWYPELFGGGVAVLDLEGDGWPDLLFVTGTGGQGLYGNRRAGTFADISAGSGLDAADAYGLGASVADYDNDGRDDVFITTAEGGRLFHNDGGRFSDVTARAGIRNADFAVSA